MAKTFNRNPLQVNTPSSSDIKNYFFNHYNWKGICTDKNFLAVDQETFADAKNVYANEEGLLRSRPAVKIKNMVFDSAIDFWNFDDVDVYLRELETGYEIDFVVDGTTYSKNLTDYKVKLIKVQDLIYCFMDGLFFYFDTVNKVFGDGLDKIYIPNTVFEAEGAETKVEPKNALTNKEKYTYVYNSEFGISSEAYGKNLTVKIDGVDYDVVFEPSSVELLTDVLFSMPSGYDYMDVSNDDTYLFYSSENRTLSYSATGKVLSKTFYLPESYGDVIVEPKFSRDSSYIVIGTTKSIYIVSVVADQSTGELRFPDFVDVKSYSVDFPWGFETPGLRLLNGGYDFLTYDEFSYFRNIYKDVGEVQRSWFYYVNQNEIVSNDTYFTYIDSISFDKSYRYTDENDKTVNGVLCVYGEINGSSSRLSLFDLNDNLSSPFSYYDSITYGGIESIKIYGDEIYFIESLNDGKYLSKIFQKDYQLEVTRSLYDSKIDVPGQNQPVYPDLISNDCTKVYFDGKIYFANNGKVKSLIADGTHKKPISYKKHLYYYGDDGKVFSTLVNNSLEFNYTTDGEHAYFNPTLISKLNNFYLANGNTLYVTEYREEDGEFRWYLPDGNKKVFPDAINGLCPISSSEMGVFFNDSIWYVQNSEGGYYTTKSKLELGIKSGSDITTSYDGSRLIFPTERGIVTLSYQDFVASTDQVITFLSDTIHLQIKEFCKDAVCLSKNDFWIVIYKKNRNEFYLLDSRNGAWWYWTLPNEVKKLVKKDDELIYLSTDGKFYYFDNANDNYFDYDGERHLIDWSITSQKLHLSQVNNYKHIVNMTFNSVIDTEDYLTFFLDVKNYREGVDEGKLENVRYSVDVLRTFVQRLNYFKVNEFQYTMRSDNANKKPLPLSLSSINIKYKIQGQVR